MHAVIEAIWVCAMPRGQTSELIAIIDSDESMQDSLRDLIESTGLVARCFGSAEEFLELECPIFCTGWIVSVAH